MKTGHLLPKSKHSFVNLFLFSSVRFGMLSNSVCRCSASGFFPPLSLQRRFLPQQGWGTFPEEGGTRDCDRLWAGMYVILITSTSMYVTVTASTTLYVTFFLIEYSLAAAFLLLHILCV